MSRDGVEALAARIGNRYVAELVWPEVNALVTERVDGALAEAEQKIEDAALYVLTEPELDRTGAELTAQILRRAEAIVRGYREERL